MDAISDADLVLEAIHQHLSYVESRLSEISDQLLLVNIEHERRQRQKVTKAPVEPVEPSRPKLPRASELTKLPKKEKPILSDKEREVAMKEKFAKSQRNKQLMSITTALESLKVQYRERYADLMEKHVQEQKRKVREKDIQWEKKQVRREERERKQRLHRKPHTFRSEAVTDYGFLQNIQQSNFYKIVAMEMELKQKGLLNSLQDIKDFWNNMLGVSDCPILPSTHSPVSWKQKPQSQVESPVWEMDEPSEEESSHSWAMTSVPHKAAVQIHTAALPKDKCSSGSVFQPCEMPPFKLVDLSLNLEGQGNCQVESHQHKARVERIQRSRRLVKRLYQIARANELATARVMEDLDIAVGFDLELLPEPVASSNTSVSYPRGGACETAKDVTSNCSGDTSKDVTSNCSGETSKDVTSNCSGETSKDVTSNCSGETSKDVTSNCSGETSKDVTSNCSGETSKDVTSNCSGETSKDVTSNCSGETSKDVTSNCSGETSKDVTSNCSGETSKDVTSEACVVKGPLKDDTTQQCSVIENILVQDSPSELSCTSSEHLLPLTMTQLVTVHTNKVIMPKSTALWSNYLTAGN